MWSKCPSQSEVNAEKKCKKVFGSMVAMLRASEDLFIYKMSRRIHVVGASINPLQNQVRRSSVCPKRLALILRRVFLSGVRVN